MKTYIFYLLLIFPISILKSQEIKLIDTNSIWNVEINYKEGDDYLQKTNIYKIGKDTILDDIGYNMLYINHNLYGFIREDSIKKVYFRTRDGRDIGSCDYLTIGMEYLLYDFGLAVGDSFLFEKNITYSKVDSIDTIILNNTIRKRWFLYRRSYSDIDTWIEGIGNTKGLFGPIQCRFEWSAFLSCFQNADELIYGAGTNGMCLTNDIKISSKSYLNIYPNPSNTVFNVDFTSLPGEKVIQVFDCAGEKFISTKTDASVYVLDKLKYPGIYYLQIQYHDQIFYNKIVFNP